MFDWNTVEMLNSAPKLKLELNTFFVYIILNTTL